MRWNTIPEKTAPPIHLKNVPSILASKKTRTSIGTMRFIGEEDGTSFPVEFWSHIIVREGKTLGAVITFIDITERKQAEAALRKSEEQNRTLLQINNAIITNLTQQALLRSISEALHPLISFDRCAITLYQPERDSFRFLAVEGELLSDYFRTGLEFSRNETCSSWVFDHQQPLVRRDLEKEQQYPNERRLVTEGIQSMCVVPLTLQGKCIGLLSVVSLQRDRYSG